MTRFFFPLMMIALMGAARAVAAAETPVPVRSATPLAAASPSPVAPAGEPERQQVIEVLLRNSSLKLSEGKYCAVELPDRPSPTLGDWMAKLLADMDAGENSIEVACDPPLAKAPDVWICHADFIHAEGDDHWKFSLELGIKGSDKSLVKGTLACAGVR